MPNPAFTIGIEEEFQSVDSQTGVLRPSINTILKKADPLLRDKLQTEMYQSMIELTSSICPTIEVARRELSDQRSKLQQLLQEDGLALISAGTHPTAKWEEQESIPKQRYLELIEEFQDVVRSRLIFGLHIHIGVGSQDLAVELINPARSWLPHLLALSSNSPFWGGRFTGIKSYRSVVWQGGSPRNGLPEIFPSAAAFQRYVQDLTNTGCILSGKDLWWDVRPHVVYDTIEFRICDMPATLEETLAIGAFCQALIAKLYWLHTHGKPFPSLPRDYIAENKWRAVRYGLDANVVDFLTQRTMTMRDALHEALDFVSDTAESLGCHQEINYLHALLDDHVGTGADRQIAIYQKSGSFETVIQHLREQTLRGLDSIPLPHDAPLPFQEISSE